MSCIPEPNQISRWRLILGQSAEPQLAGYSPGGSIQLSEEEMIMDRALAAIYDNTDGGAEAGSAAAGQRAAGQGKSAPRLAQWLGDVRSFFPEDVVSIIQNDAMERKGWKQLLFEPEVLATVKPDIQLVGTLLSLKGKIPEKTKDPARLLVKAVVDELVQR
ncbi:hypothetical protein GNF85_18770, partial [Clostridium perfringens]